MWYLFLCRPTASSELQDTMYKYNTIHAKLLHKKSTNLDFHNGMISILPNYLYFKHLMYTLPWTLMPSYTPISLLYPRDHVKQTISLMASQPS